MIRRLLGRAAVPVIALSAMAYFAQHALFDDHGLRRLLALSDSIAKREAEFERRTAELAAMEAQVRALDPSSIDPDLLDERAREVLGFARPDEIIIYKPE